MDEFELTQSFVQEDQKNQFLDQDFKYQNCPHCERNFFIGKLKYHLKLCKPSNPMIKSPIRRNKKSHFSATTSKPTLFQHQQNAQSPQQIPSPQSKFKKCSFCMATFPLSMIKRHQQKCNLKPSPQRRSSDLNSLQSKTNIEFQFRKDIKESSSALPRIRNSARQHKNFQRKFVSQDIDKGRSSYTVKIRQELSCFKKALQVQQIQCPYCCRKFSKDASERHIPICQKLKYQQIQQISLKKHAKSSIYKINAPIKKSLLFRQKAIPNVNREETQLEIKSARLSKAQKINRQKINNTSFLKIEKQKQQVQQNVQNLCLSEKNDQIQEQIYQNLQKEENNIEFQHNNMNMTFSKSFNNPKIQIDKQKQFIPQKLQRQLDTLDLPSKDKEQLSEIDDSESLCDNSLEAENEFLHVSESKKKIFEQIHENKRQTIFEANPGFEQSLTHPSLKNIKLKISLKDVQDQSRKKDIQIKAQNNSIEQ